MYIQFSNLYIHDIHATFFSKNTTFFSKSTTFFSKPMECSIEFSESVRWTKRRTGTILS